MEKPAEAPTRAYLISYHLADKNRYHQDLIDKIKSFSDSYCQIFEASFIIKCDKGLKELMHDLKSFVDEKDKLIIFRLTTKAEGTGFDGETTSWMIEHFLS